ETSRRTGEDDPESSAVEFRIGDDPSQDTDVSRGQPAEQVINSIQFDDVSLAEAMKPFAEQTGLNVICSAEAGNTQVSVFLRDIKPMAALDAIVKANGLFYRKDEESGVIRIATSDEYQKDLTSFREERTKVFTLLYPNPVAVAQVISQVFGDRVELNTADADIDDLQDLSNRFNRFDLVDGRALGLGTFDGTGNGGGLAGAGVGQNALGQNGLGLGLGGLGLGGASGQLLGSGLTQRSRNRNNTGSVQRDLDVEDLSSDEIQSIENQLAQSGRLSVADQARLMRRNKATIYVSTIRRNNQIVVRTGDQQSMEEIERLVKQLDVPTPTVLLEVKVLRVQLADGIHCAFEYLAGDGTDGVAFSDGNQLDPFPGGSVVGRALAEGLGLAGNVPGALSFQVVDNNFRYRLQALESQSRVTALATPLILTANNEVSRIFVGDTLPFTVGFTPSQVVGGINAGGAVSATPITELRDVGQSLLITPNINADRSVTLRVVEENSERIIGGASIPVPDASGAGVTAVNVDTVRRRTVSGTVVAQDGMAVALGGLIEESVSDAKDQVPVLGDIPGLGLLFRRKASNRSRSELVVVIRPYVFNTPSEAAATSQSVLSELSMHPNSPDAMGSLDTYLPCKVVRSDPECQSRAKLFRFHHVKN
ncbi:MAG: hypothetical protein AAGA03_14220, partial [Planctomycetota bacterium]